MVGPAASAAPPKQSKELASAIYDDWKRQVVDEAKKRAVGQNVDYETFKNMVSVAHLRPIGAAKTVKHEAMLPSWRYNDDGTAPSSEQQAIAAAAMALRSKEPSEPPSTSGDFYREWRRNCPSLDAKYRYLRLVGPNGLQQLFKVEISVDALKDVLTALEACWLVHAGAAEDGAEGSGAALSEAVFVVSVLAALSQAGRFGLTLKLLGSGPKAVLASLFSQLQGAVDAAAAGNLPMPAVPHNSDTQLRMPTPAEFDQLKAAYCVA
uniref:Uncharacterized protein n=1 Tax=Chlamydomonas euryale TaxID=1486919 RepID=A0A7R9V6A5_9CHLO|mmetsp:Transcript_1853/g.4906  ORF Transcript_1853/g.4906 Transcript_1853/m.4906 type:complete len:265 (+) Transcript_1853:88-882(+)